MLTKVSKIIFILTFFSRIIFIILASIPFIFAGTILSLSYRCFFASSSRIYFADLSGASIGCVLVIVILQFLGAINTGIFFYVL